MAKKEIQIVAFNNPYPPDFGGAIDVYFKIKALAALGVKIDLHIYHNKRDDISGLKPYCQNIKLYKQNTQITKHLSMLPYSVSSRNSKALYENLKQKNAPILFESLRTCAILNHPFKQKVAIRCHNIEHYYCWGLFKSEKNLIKKLAFFLESLKFKNFESILKKADFLLPISHYEYSYYSRNFSTASYYLPVFQGGKRKVSQSGFGKYALYHGDLSTADNVKSAFFLVDVFKDLNYPLIIASSFLPKKLYKRVKNYKNITFDLILNESQLEKLIQNAQINTLYSFQKSGTKLKVFNALFNGRHCIVNKNIVDDPEIISICEVAENKKDYKIKVENLFQKEFLDDKTRDAVLKKYDSKLNAQKLVKLLF